MTSEDAARRHAERDASGYDSAPFIAEFYDYVVPYAARPDIDFYVDIARENGGPVLDSGAEPAAFSFPPLG
jgi:hypothetical protein